MKRIVIILSIFFVMFTYSVMKHSMAMAETTSKIASAAPMTIAAPDKQGCISIHWGTSGYTVCPPKPLVCATLDNVSNEATWTNRNGSVQVASYSDLGGRWLKFNRPVPKQVRMAEVSMQVGMAGPKTITVCTH